MTRVGLFLIRFSSLCILLLLGACSGFQGVVFERLADGGIGEKIPAAGITFTSEDATTRKTVTSASNGYYRITLDPARYVVDATHPRYHDYSSSPGFFVVTGGGYQTGNIFMHRRGYDVLLITTSRLEKVPGFEAAVAEYIRVLEDTEGLLASYIELDTLACQETYGVKADDPSDWHQISEVLSVIIDATDASYVVILGGEDVVPRPALSVPSGDGPVLVANDSWYADQDGDQIVDDGLSIARFPDVLNGSDRVLVALQTATELHTAGGFALDAPVNFFDADYPTPPYGVCSECTMRDEFFALMSGSNYIKFAGHGSPVGFYSNAGHTKFSIDYMDSVDLVTNHPVILGYYSCNTGVTYPDQPTLSSEFSAAGVAAFVARTTTEGVPTFVAEVFPERLEAGERIGDALYRAMREVVLDRGDAFKASAGHLCLYGDPTLRRR